MKDLSRTINLCCPICSGTSFSSLDVEEENLSDAPNSTRVQCDNCKRIFTKQQIIETNSEIIEKGIKDLENDIVHELDNELQKCLNK